MYSFVNCILLLRARRTSGIKPKRRHASSDAKKGASAITVAIQIYSGFSKNYNTETL